MQKIENKNAAMEYTMLLMPSINRELTKEVGAGERRSAS